MVESSDPREVRDLAMETTQEIRVIVYHEADRWVAQCLEYDIGTQARNLSDLRLQLDLTLAMEGHESLKHHGEPFAGIDPAPKYFHELWEKRSGLFTPVDGRESRAPDTPPYEMALCA